MSGNTNDVPELFVGTRDIYNIDAYTDTELYKLLDLSNPTDRELEAKILHMIWKYNNFHNESGERLVRFFQQIYDRFFENSEDEEDDGIRYEFGPNLTPKEFEGMANMDDAGKDDSKGDGKGETGKNDTTLTDNRKFGYNVALDYSKDNLNPLLKQTTKRIISIDSQYRENKSTSATNFTFNLSNPLRDVVSLKLYSFQLPFTWYTINSNFGSNFFYLKGYSNGINNGNHDIKVEISVGNYTAQGLVTAVNTALGQLQTNSLYSDISFGNTQVTYDTNSSKATFQFDITNLYNEGYYQLYFPAPNNKTTFANSIQAFLGFTDPSNNIYSPGVVYSNLSILPLSGPVTTQNDSIPTAKISTANNYFTIIHYQDTKGLNVYDSATSSVVNQYTVTLSGLTVGGVYSRTQLFNEVAAQLKNATNNPELDVGFSSLIRVDVSNLAVSNLAGQGFSHYELRIRLNRYTTKNIPSSKVVVVFPVDYDIWLGASSVFVFDNQYNELSDVIASGAPRENIVIFQSTPTITFQCKSDNIYYDVNSNNYVVNVQPPQTNTGYYISEFYDNINSGLVSTNTNSVNASNKNGVLRILGTSSSDPDNTTMKEVNVNSLPTFDFTVDLLKQFTNFDFYADISNSDFVNQFGVTNSNGITLSNVDTRYYGGFAVNYKDNFAIVGGKTGAAGSNISYSTDYGNTWAASANGSQVFTDRCNGVTFGSLGYYKNTTVSGNAYNFTSIACEINGCKLVAVDALDSSGNVGGIWTSVDSGGTWAKNTDVATQNLYWTSVSSNNNGQYLTAVSSSNGDIWGSMNYGTTWIRYTTYNANFNCVAMDASGSQVVATVYGGPIYISRAANMSGTNRTFVVSKSGGYNWSGVASSASGSNLVAVVYGGSIWLSSDYGTTWSQVSNVILQTQNWVSVTMTGDGSILYAATYNNGLWSSTNYGVTWNQINTINLGISKYITCNALDGSRLVLITKSGIYNSINRGQTWYQKDTAPYFQNQLWSSATLTWNGTAGYACVNGGGIWQILSKLKYSWNTVFNLVSGTVTFPKYPLSIATDFSGGSVVVLDPSGVWYSVDSGNSFVKSTTVTQNWNSISMSSYGGNLIASGYGGSIYLGSIVNGSFSGWARSNGAPISARWSAVASDSTGTNLAAVISGGNVWTSGNYGAVWSENTVPSNLNWSSIASNASGTKLVATVMGGNIWLGTNTGTWSWSNSSDTNTRNKNWISVDCDATGVILISAVKNGGIWISYDSGTTWKQNSDVAVQKKYWSSVACNSYGNIMFASEYGGKIWISSDAGSTWNPYINQNKVPNSASWLPIACNGTGDRVYVGNYGASGIGPVAQGSYQGNSWKLTLTAFNAVASNSNGNKVAVVTNNNGIYASGDYGSTWQRGSGTSNTNFLSVDGSADGSKYAANSSNSVYISTNSGNIWNGTASSFPVSGISSVICDSNCSQLMVSTKRNGVYLSPDSGNLWTHNISGFASMVSNRQGITGLVANGGIWSTSDVTRTLALSTSSNIQNRSWNYVVSGTNGVNLIAVDPSGNWLSTTYGKQWNINVSFFKSVAMNSTGTFLVGVVYGGGIWTSGNTGTTWVRYPDFKNKFWSSVSCSSDGKVLVAVEYGGGIYVSVNTGVFWQLNTTVSNQNWVSVACSSADGQYMYAAISGGTIWTSSNAGTTWSVSTSGNITAPVANWVTVDTNVDGTLAVGIVSGGSIYISRNFGIWNSVTATSGIANPDQKWSSISMNSSGQFLVVAANGDALYVSSNYGFIWTIISNVSTQNNPWSSVAINGSGTTFYAVENGGTVWQGVYASNLWTVSQNTGVVLNLSANGATQSWSFVACNYDSSRVMAVSDQVGNCLSSDGGATWYLNVGIFRSLTTTFDGQILTVMYGGGIWKSSDFGVTWYLNSKISTQNKTWVTVSNAVNSVRIIATTDKGEQWVSTDSGTTWTLNVFDFKAVASNNDGSKLVRVVYGGGIWLSTDYGYTWRLNVSNVTLQNQLWNCVASSYDGRVLVAGVYNGGIWTSVDYGANWTQNPNPVLQNLKWSSVANNSDGTVLVATAYSGGIFTSNDYGVTWKNSISAFKSMAGTQDGRNFVGVIYGVGIYLSSDSGVTWTIQTTGYANTLSGGPTTNLLNLKWISVACGSGMIFAGVNAGYMFYVASEDGYIFAYTVGFDLYYNVINLWVDTNISNYKKNGYWRSITCDNSGYYVMCAEYNGQIWTGKNTNNTGLLLWSITKVGSSTSPFIVIAVSDTYYYGITRYDTQQGNKGIYFSQDKGYSWTAVVDPNLTNSNWTSITCDKFGKNVYATASNEYGNLASGIWMSNDYGKTWYVSNNTDTFWFTITCDYTGTQIVAASRNFNGAGIISISKNSGKTWVDVFSDYDYDFSVVTCTPNGKNIVALNNNNTIYVSNNYGVIWSTVSVSSTNGEGTALAISSDGTKILATFLNIPMLSLNSGITFTNIYFGPGVVNYGATTCNSDASIMIIAIGYAGVTTYNNLYYGGIWISYDFGTTWNLSSTTSDGTYITNRNWVILKSNSDGSCLNAIDVFGNIYQSVDRGAVWKNISNQYYKWSSIVSNIDGSKFFATVEDGGIYYYNNNSFVSSWNIIGDSSVQNKKWCSIACDSSGNYLIAAAQCGQGVYVSNNSGVNWAMVTQQNMQNNYWTSVAVDASSTTFYVSGLFGAGIWSYIPSISNTWTQNTGTQYQDWNFISNRAFGNSFFAGSDTGTLWDISSNKQWVSNPNFNNKANGIQNQYWVSSSDNSAGDNLQAVVYGGYNFGSYDNGHNWTIDASVNTVDGSVVNYKWTAITNNIDGIKHLATIDASGVFMYSKIIINYISEPAVQNIFIGCSIASDSVGKNLIVTALDANQQYNQFLSYVKREGFILRSTDYGKTWTVPIKILDPTTLTYSTQLYDRNTRYWGSISVNSLFIVVGTMGIWKSIDFGYSWYYSKLYDINGNLYTVGQDTNYYHNISVKAIACSSDGKYMVALSYYILKSTDYGETWITMNDNNGNGYVTITTSDDLDDYYIGWKHNSVAMSSDGKYVYATKFNKIYTFTNFLVNMTYIVLIFSPSVVLCRNITCDSTGQYAYVTVNSGVYLYSTNNYGAGWNQNYNIYTNTGTSSFGVPLNTSSRFNTLNCNKYGNKVVVTVGSSVYTSINYGVTFTKISDLSLNSTYFDYSSFYDPFYVSYSDIVPAICVNSNDYFYITSYQQLLYGGPIYDNKTAWKNIYSKDVSWNAICSNSDSSTVYATAYKGGIWKGVYYDLTNSWNWTQTPAPAVAWSSVTCDVSGARIVSTTDTNSTYTSYDSGNTWIDVATFNASAISTNGLTIYNTVYGGGVWYSSNTGYTLTKISNNLSDASWNAITCNSSGTIASAAVLGGSIYVYNTNYSWYSCSVRDFSNQILFMSGSVGVDSSGNVQVFYSNNQFPNILSSSGMGANTMGQSYPSSVNINVTTIPYFDKLYPSATYYDLSGNNAIYWSGGGKINTGFDFILTISYSPIPTPWIMVSDVNNSNWQYLQMDASGTSIYAIDASNVAYTSTNGGNSWNLFDVSTFKTVAGSADGTKLFGVVYGGDIWSSQDTGNTWSRSGLSYQNWTGISCDLSGNNVFASVYGGNIWITSNSSSGWSEYSSIPSKNWQSVASNSDGTRVVATAMADVSYSEIWSLTKNGYVWTSTLNNSLSLQNTSVDFVSSDYSGKNLYAAVNNYGVWNSVNYGASWNGIISQFPLTYFSINITVVDTQGVTRTFDGFFGVDMKKIVKVFYDFNAADFNSNILTYTGNDNGADYVFDASNNVFSNNGTAITSIPTLDAVYGATEWNLAFQNGANVLSYKSVGGTWTVLNSTVTFTVRNLRFTAQKLAVAVGQGGNTIAYSVDLGKTWNGIASATSIFSAGNRVVWNGAKFVAVGQPATNGSASADAIAYSYDGVDWFPVNSSGFDVSGVANDIHYDSSFNSWVVVGADISNNSLATIFYSSDGNYWRRAYNNPFRDIWSGFGTYVTSNNPYVVRGNGIGFGVSCNGNVWVATGYSPTGNSIAYSSDGNVWVSGNADLFKYGWGEAVQWNGNSWLAVGRGRNVAVTSSDGVNWSGESFVGTDVLWTSNNEGRSPVRDPFGVSTLVELFGSASSTFNRGIHNVVWNGRVWIAVGESGFAGNSVAYSVDGRLWQTGQGYVADVSWNAPFDNGLLTNSIYNVRSDASGLLVLTGSFPVNPLGTYTLTAGSSLLKIYPNPNSGNKFSPVDVLVPTTTNFASLGALQVYINALLNGYRDPYNGNHYVLAGSYVTFLTSGGVVNVTFTVSVLKTMKQQNYNVVFADPSNNSGVFQSATNAWWKYLAVWQPIFDLSNAAYNTVANVNYSQIIGKYPIPDQGTDLSNTLIILGDTYANNTFMVEPQLGVDGLASDYSVTITIPDGSYSFVTLKNIINQQLATATNTNADTGTIETLCLGSFLNASVSINHSYFRLNINKIFNASDYSLVFYDPFSFSTCISGKSTLQNVSWDTTLGWILGFRNYTDYPLYLLLKGATSLGSSVFAIQGDTAVSVNIYNYFMITLDDYNQNHMNDGLVTTTQQENDLPLPSYANRALLKCNPTSPGQMLVPSTNTDSTSSSYDVINLRRNLTQNQLYSAQAVIDQTTNNVFNATQNSQAIALKQKKNTRYYSNGPFAQDVFALIPLKTAGMAPNTVYVDYSGTLQNQDRLYFGPVNIHRMTVSLINDRGEIVDLNGANWSFSILCEQLYQQQKT